MEIFNRLIAHFNLSKSKLLLANLRIELKHIVHLCRFHELVKLFVDNKFQKVINSVLVGANLKLGRQNLQIEAGKNPTKERGF